MNNTNEVHRVKYYYHKDSIVGNIFTACLLIGEDKEILSRGIAICSLLDSFSKKEGRRKSYSRAMKAYWSESDSGIINEVYLKSKFINRKFKTQEDRIIENSHLVSVSQQSAENLKFVNVSISRNYPIYKTSQFFKFKSEYAPIPTELEKKILRIGKND